MPIYRPRMLIGSFLFVPVARPSGDFGPLLRGGWTLDYEMFFYLLLAASLALPKRVAIATTAAALIAATMIAGPIAGWPEPIALEFIYGMLLALLVQHAKCSRGAALSLVV